MVIAVVAGYCICEDSNLELQKSEIKGLADGSNDQRSTLKIRRPRTRTLRHRVHALGPQEQQLERWVGK